MKQIIKSIKKNVMNQKIRLFNLVIIAILSIGPIRDAAAQEVLSLTLENALRIALTKEYFVRTWKNRV